MAGFNPALIGTLLQAIVQDPSKAASALAQTGAAPPTIAPQQAPFPFPAPRGPVTAPLAPVRPDGGGLVPGQSSAPPDPTAGGGVLNKGIGLGVNKTAAPGAGAPPVNPLEALQAPVQSQPLPAPSAGRPGLGGQVNPQILQLLLQALQGGGAPGGAPPNQSLGAILGQRR